MERVGGIVGQKPVRSLENVSWELVCPRGL